MPFQKGNHWGRDAAEAKLFDANLRRACAQEDGKRVRAAAEKLLTAASEGEPWAIGMLADRLDGKATEHVSVRHERSEMTRDQLLERLAAIQAERAAAGRAGNARGNAAAGRRAEEPAQVH